MRPPDGYESWLDATSLEGANLPTRFLTSVYWSITTITTVGYGDISPVTPMEQAFGIVVMAVGAIIYSVLFASMTNLISSMNISEAKYVRAE